MPAPKYRTAGETAALTGVSVKALRIYERHGLIAPGRSRAGYRVYGPEDLERLHQVLALRSLGLTLAEIAAFLAGPGDRLAPILEAQEQALHTRIATLTAAATAVAVARHRLAAGEDLSVDDLVTLTQEIVMTERKPDWRDSFARLFARRFTDEERQALLDPAAAQPAGVDMAERRQLLAEATALVGEDPGSPEVLALARLWRDRALGFAGGDREKLVRLQAVFDDALADPDVAATLPWRAELALIKAATERLEAIEAGKV
jgi:DNA-binding transcriptional MerR regulator